MPLSLKRLATTPKTENFQAPLIKFGTFAQRGEERMNFSVNIEMFSEMNKSIQATTIDVSVNGLKVKASKEHLFKPEERLTVQFRGLEKEYSGISRILFPLQLWIPPKNSLESLEKKLSLLKKD